MEYIWRMIIVLMFEDLIQLTVLYILPASIIAVE